MFNPLPSVAPGLMSEVDFPSMARICRTRKAEGLPRTQPEAFKLSRDIPESNLLGVVRRCST